MGADGATLGLSLWKVNGCCTMKTLWQRLKSVHVSVDVGGQGSNGLGSPPMQHGPCTRPSWPLPPH